LRHEGTSRLAPLYQLHELAAITGHRNYGTLRRYYLTGPFYPERIWKGLIFLSRICAALTWLELTSGNRVERAREATWAGDVVLGELFLELNREDK
jgi:hypothetical protein